MYNGFMKKLDEKTKNMILFEVIVMIFIVILYIIVKTEIIKLVPHCYILEKTGILCPSCGGTRCIKALLSFNISEAFKMNAFYTITIIYLLILNVVYILNTIFKTNKFKIIYIKKVHLIIWLITLILYTVFRNIFIYINA